MLFHALFLPLGLPLFLPFLLKVLDFSDFPLSFYLPCGTSLPLVNPLSRFLLHLLTILIIRVLCIA